MGSECVPQLHIYFVPFLARGHIIPTVEMAKLFASRGVKATIITTPYNEPMISKTIEKSKSTTLSIDVKTIKFPGRKFGLPQGCENADSVTSPSMFIALLKATQFLQEPLEQLLQEDNPNCLIADMFFPWATDSAAKFGIPRLVFHGTSVFWLCAAVCMRLYEPYKKVSSESEAFVIPSLPGGIQFTKKQLPDFLQQDEENIVGKMLLESQDSELRSYGVVTNSFYELEEVYADYYKNVLGRRAWNLGPLSLCNREKSQKGRESGFIDHSCLKWLDSKKPNSVIYICFGTVACFPESQLREIAMALEASGQQFIWVVRRVKNKAEEVEEEGEEVEKEKWLPEGFENRVEGKGVIIRSWAPQVQILEHEAVGGFVTHCGWNSIMEGVCAGIPMVTWPVLAEQFYNEKLVSEVLKIGVPVGVKKWDGLMGDSVKKEAIEKALKNITAGKEAEEMRNRAKEVAHKARMAVEKGGSSYLDLNALIGELGSR